MAKRQDTYSMQGLSTTGKRTLLDWLLFSTTSCSVEIFESQRKSSENVKFWNQEISLQSSGKKLKQADQRPPRTSWPHLLKVSSHHQVSLVPCSDVLSCFTYSLQKWVLTFSLCWIRSHLWMKRGGCQLSSWAMKVTATTVRMMTTLLESLQVSFHIFLTGHTLSVDGYLSICYLWIGK